MELKCRYDELKLRAGFDFKMICCGIKITIEGKRFYSAAFPKKNDAFMLDLIDGHSYVVPGWIGKSTIIRTR